MDAGEVMPLFSKHRLCIGNRAVIDRSPMFYSNTITRLQKKIIQHMRNDLQTFVSFFSRNVSSPCYSQTCDGNGVFECSKPKKTHFEATIITLSFNSRVYTPAQSNQRRFTRRAPTSYIGNISLLHLYTILLYHQIAFG